MDGYGDKKRALKKLSTLVTKIGYPRKWKSYSKLAMQEDSYVQNIIRLNVFHFKYEISKSASGPTKPNGICHPRP